MKRLGEVRKSMFSNLLHFMRRSPINRFIVGYGTFFGLGLLVYLSIVGLILPIYYAVAPPRSFVDYYYAKVADTPVGNDPQMTLCRRINYDAIRIEGVRTFIYYQDDKTPVQVKDRDISASVSKDESDSNCVNVRLEGQPQKEGTYSTYTVIEFYVHGNRKTYSYESNKYKMLPATQTSEERIKYLQQQIDDLKAENTAVEQPAATQSAPIPQSTAPTQQNTAKTTPEAPKTAEKPAETKTEQPKPAEPTLIGRLNQALSRLGL